MMTVDFVLTLEHSLRKLFSELKQYIDKEGNALVPREYKALGRWVDRQRNLHKSDDLSPERVKQLTDVGFVFEPHETLWSERFNQLLGYIKEHGDALVPQEYEENISLGHWVQKQRYKYKTNTISEERIQQLIDVGFVFDVLEAQWLEKFAQLKIYRREFGDTLVPRQHALGSWVWWQRREYKASMEKKLEGESQNLKTANSAIDADTTNSSPGKSGMTEERIRLLESEDFIWDPKEYLWNLRFEELREWITLNGHGAITCGKNYSSLELWASRQRKMYKQYRNGEKTSLTKERIAKLQSIGFIFEVGKSR